MRTLLHLLGTARLSDDVPITDIMVDIETTGTDPHTTAMIQLAAIPFNYETSAIGPAFNRCLNIPKGRYWDEDTRRWWGQQKAGILQGIFDKMEDPRLVITDFFDYVCRLGGPLRFWSRGSFDWWFVQSYMDQYELTMPFSASTRRWISAPSRRVFAALRTSPT
jgi:hypothetical protein